MNIKRLIAVIVFAFGFGFTCLALMSIWGIGVPVAGGPLDKLIPTTGILTAAFLALLAIIVMVEKKNGGK